MNTAQRDQVLLEMSEKMGSVLTEVKSLKERQTDTLDYVRGVSARVGALERWRAYVLGLAAAISAFVAWVAK